MCTHTDTHTYILFYRADIDAINKGTIPDEGEIDFLLVFWVCEDHGPVGTWGLEDLGPRISDLGCGWGGVEYGVWSIEYG